MNARVTTAALALAAAAVLAATAQGSPPPATSAQSGVPAIDQMVVFRGGTAVAKRVRPKPATATVEGRTCVVAARTPMAALLHSDPGPIRFHDYGDCSRRAADSVGLFVEAMRGQRNRGLNGWVYKIGRKTATAGAADPSGPFGNGRLTRGQKVLWFYGLYGDGGFQRSLEVATAVDGRRVSVTVTGYDDAGEGVAVAGATVRGGGERATTDGDGKATLTLGRGSHRVHAEKKGTIRSFAKRVKIG